MNTRYGTESRRPRQGRSTGQAPRWAHREQMERSHLRAESVSLQRESEILNKATVDAARNTQCSRWRGRARTTPGPDVSGPDGERTRLPRLEARLHARSHAADGCTDGSADLRHSRRTQGGLRQLENGQGVMGAWGGSFQAASRTTDARPRHPCAPLAAGQGDDGLDAQSASGVEPAQLGLHAIRPEPDMDIGHRDRRADGGEVRTETIRGAAASLGSGQSASQPLQATLKAYGMEGAMSRKGNCRNHAQLRVGVTVSTTSEPMGGVMQHGTNDGAHTILGTVLSKAHLGDVLWDVPVQLVPHSVHRLYRRLPSRVGLLLL